MAELAKLLVINAICGISGEDWFEISQIVIETKVDTSERIVQAKQLLYT